MPGGELMYTVLPSTSVAHRHNNHPDVWFHRKYAQRQPDLSGFLPIDLSCYLRDPHFGNGSFYFLSTSIAADLSILCHAFELVLEEESPTLVPDASGETFQYYMAYFLHWQFTSAVGPAIIGSSGHSCCK